jgi:general secretion pathway protein B
MSLILEALRKSEAERRRGETPNLYAELPPAPHAGRNGVPAWGWWLLAVVMLLAASWGVSRGMRNPPASSTRAVHAPATGAMVAEQPRGPTLPSVRRLSPPPAPAPAVPTSPAPPIVAAESDMPAGSATAMPVPRSLPPAPVAAGPAEGVLHLSDLSVDERKALPPLKLSMHMWNDDPAQRFVILDGNRLHEGDRTGDAVVAAITSDGVVLDWNGRRLKLPIH